MVAIPNSSPIKKPKPVEPLSYYPCIFSPYLLTIQKVDSDEHIVLARGSSVHIDDISPHNVIGVSILICGRIFSISVAT